MIVGIVGSEAAKFTPETEAEARKAIRLCLLPEDMVISGACHLGGIDEWAIEEGIALGLATENFPPAIHKWEGGYKQRNLQIAEKCDKLICITISAYPTNYKGMRFNFCYHCKTNAHIKSGGCWTMKQAEKLGKQTQLIVI